MSCSGSSLSPCINPDLVQRLFAATGTFTFLAAGIAVGILTIPLIASVAEDAMFAVPGRSARPPTGSAPGAGS